MRALLVVATALLAGCDWNDAEQEACRRTGKCDGGISGSDAGTLTPRELQPGSLVGLVSMSDTRAWVVIAPGGGATTGVYTLAPVTGAKTKMGLSAQLLAPRAVFAGRGLGSMAVLESNGRVTTERESEGDAGIMVFSGLDDAQLVSHYSDVQLNVSVWGRNGGAGYLQGVQPASSGAGTASQRDCITPTFHDVEVLGADLKQCAVIALHADLTGCNSAQFTSAGAWIEHVNNVGARRTVLLGEATPGPFAVGRLEDDAVVPLVGYATPTELKVEALNLSGATLTLNSRATLSAPLARFGDFVRDSNELVITGTTRGEVTPSSGPALAGASTPYAFAARLSGTPWLVRLGPASSNGRVLGVKVGTSMVFAWDSPTGVVWTTLAEADGRPLGP